MATTGDCPADVVPSERVVAAVSDATGRDPLDLEPLHEVVDPDALNRFVRPPSEGRPPVPGWLVFRWADCEVTLYGDGRIDIERADAWQDPVGNRSHVGTADD